MTFIQLPILFVNIQIMCLSFSSLMLMLVHYFKNMSFWFLLMFYEGASFSVIFSKQKCKEVGRPGKNMAAHTQHPGHNKSTQLQNLNVFHNSCPYFCTISQWVLKRKSLILRRKIYCRSLCLLKYFSVMAEPNWNFEERFPSIQGWL